MKSLKHILFSVFVCIILLSANTLNSQTINRMKDRFYIGTINVFTRYGLSEQGHIDNYQDLQLNAMQNYCGHYDYDSTFDGGFFTNVSDYSSYINGQLIKWSNSSIGLNNTMLVEREKILRAGYGQRSTYRVKYTASELNSGFISPGYGFINRIKSSQTDTWYQTNFGESVNAINCVQGKRKDISLRIYTKTVSR